MAIKDREKLMKKLEKHLRMTTRQLIKIDTVEEALQYLANSFRSELYCDFVGVILNEFGHFVPKVWSGNVATIANEFPIPAESCSEKLLTHSLTYDIAEECTLSLLLKKADVRTWFTVPLKDEIHHFGFCIVGFLSYVPLLEMENQFVEFGQDVAFAMGMARQKEKQMKKIEGIEWISKNLSLESSIEDQFAELTSLAGKITYSDFACFYLYNEKENCFELQEPSFGNRYQPSRIMVEENYVIKDHFPFFEQAGGDQLTIPIVVNLKTIGVFHVEHKGEFTYSTDDLKVLELLGNHMGTIIENARLYNREKEHRNRLTYLLDYQQALVKETIQHDNFNGITSMLGSLFKDAVVLFDSFMRPISSNRIEEGFLTKLIEDALYKRKKDIFTIHEEKGSFFSVWSVRGADKVLGYLAVRMNEKEMDEFDRLTIELARNICSIQFIKQKLVLDAKEQVKDSFISRLLVEKIEDEESILQYANLFQWDLFQHHRIAVLSIDLAEDEIIGCNLLEQQAKKTIVWEFVKVRMAEKDKSIVSAMHNDQYIFIIPVNRNEIKNSFWSHFYDHINQLAKKSPSNCKITVGIGCKTERIHEYYTSYQQATQALHIVHNRLRQKGYSLFEELGSYTILHQLENSPTTKLFMNNQLGPLLKYSDNKNMDLFDTLRVYLQNNGNVKSTADELYIHRSSLLYRLEKIEALLECKLNDAEVRFNLMMACKLYDMNGNLSI